MHIRILKKYITQKLIERDIFKKMLEVRLGTVRCGYELNLQKVVLG